MGAQIKLQELGRQQLVRTTDEQAEASPTNIKYVSKKPRAWGLFVNREDTQCNRPSTSNRETL
jgi:hypothetical protein